MKDKNSNIGIFKLDKTSSLLLLWKYMLQIEWKILWQLQNQSCPTLSELHPSCIFTYFPDASKWLINNPLLIVWLTWKYSKTNLRKCIFFLKSISTHVALDLCIWMCPRVGVLPRSFRGSFIYKFIIAQCFIREGCTLPLLTVLLPKWYE